VNLLTAINYDLDEIYQTSKTVEKRRRKKNGYVL
jgi:hypothetical protein